MKNRNQAIISLLIYQGLSSKELIGLKLGDIDLDNQSIYIRRNGRNNSRSFQLRDQQYIWLRDYIEKDRSNLVHNKHEEALFIGIRGDELTVDGLHAIISRLNHAFSKCISPKSIRESVISHWLNVKKYELENVQLMAGHRYPSSTEKYIRHLGAK